jgi:signal peptidase II
VPGKSRAKITYLSFAFLIFLADFLSKRLVIQRLEFGESLPLIKGIFHITLVANTGTAFGLFKNLSLFFISFSVAAIIIISYLLIKGKNQGGFYNISLALILSGASGNLLDRLTHGFIVDFLDFRIWPVFNLADSAITIGVGWLLFRLLLDKKTSRE